VDALVLTGKAFIATHLEMRHPLSNYGVLDVIRITDDHIKLKDLVEKPRPEDAPSNWVVSGRYLLPPSIFSILHAIHPGRLGEIQLTDALKVLVREENVDGFVFKGQSLDTGNVASWLAANFHFAQKEPAYAEILASIQPDLR
jgi:UTP--glucose-1-phosphate uridylyltransferase